MLHILLMILKIIGIIIAAALGLVLLIVLIVTFAPLKYKVDAKSDGTLESIDVSVRYSWLFRLISGYVLYRENETDWQLRIAWKKFHQEEEEKESEQPPKETNRKEEPKRETVSKKEEPKTEPVSTKREEESKEAKASKKPSGKRRKRKQTVTEKINAFFRKIKYTIRKIYDNIKVVKEKKDKIIAFLQDEVHKRAWKKMKKELVRLMRFLKPKQITGRVHFGFEEPYYTGKTLAALAVLYPYYGKNVSIQPDFEKKVLEGELHVKGHVRGIYAAIVFFNILVNKDIRTSYKHIREFEL